MGAMVGAGTAGAGNALTSNPFTTEALKSGVTSTVPSHLTSDAVTSGVTSAGVSGVNNSVMQNPDFIGSHLTDDFNSQMLQNNYAGTYTDGIADPLQAYPSFDNPVSSTAEELAMADGGYGGGILDSIGEGIGGATDYLSDLTGMDRGDVSAMTLSQGANLLQPTPPEKIQHAPVGQGISRPNVDLSQSQGSLLSSNPMTSGAGGQQLTPEEIQMLKQKGLL